ncbi:MAG TPA: hypothetical protein VEK07_12590 [Polyangiaceae bacterium]|nr:hypothetical protein [Polyangiaceae bacterium]
MTSAIRRGLSTIAATTTIFVGSLSHADEGATQEQKAAAQALFEQARSLVEQERFAEACPKLAESERLDPGIGTLLWLADCYENVGQTASAWASFKEAAAAAAQKHDGREHVARDRAARLESKLSRLTIGVGPGAAVEGLRVHRDGMLVGSAEWGLPLPLDPGSHTVTATAPGRQPWSSTVLIGTGEQPDPITIPTLTPIPSGSAESDSPRPRSGMEGAPSSENSSEGPADHRSADRASSDSSADPNRGNGQRIGGIAVAAAGLAGIAVGAVYSFEAKATYDQSNTDGHCQSDNVCDAAGKSDRSRASSLALVATVAMGAGAAAAATGALVFFAAPRPAPAAVALTPGPAGGSVRLMWTW